MLAAHHLLLGHGLAARALGDTLGKGAQIGISLNLCAVTPVSTSDGDAAAAQRVDAHLNRWFLDPVLLGSYPEELLEESVLLAGADFVQADDLETIHAHIDFLGVNYYTQRRVASPEIGNVARQKSAYASWLAADDQPRSDVPRTGAGWTIEPDGLTTLLLRLRQDYGDIPLYITENGAAFYDYADPTGAVRDPERIDFLRQHFVAAHAAISQGVNLRGYFVWSLMDNFEWAQGYSQRFGIVFVDYRTKERVPKASAYWYQDVIAANAVETASSTNGNTVAALAGAAATNPV